MGVSFGWNLLGKDWVGECAGALVRASRFVAWMVLALGVYGGCVWCTPENALAGSGPGNCDRQFIQRVFDRKIKDTRSGTNVPTATIHLEYVEVAGLKNSSIEKKINRRLQKAAGISTPYDGTEDVFLTTRQVSMHGDLMSVAFESTYYAHGAAGAVNFLECVNLDMHDGNAVKLGDLFQPGYESKINALAQEWFASRDMVHHFAGVGDDQKYYLDDEYLYLCFSEYEVAAGSEGAVAVAIRLRDMREFIRKNGPLVSIF